MFYRFMRFVFLCSAQVLYGLRVAGRENIPKKGAFILCCNHIHAFDPAIFGVSMRRRLSFMAKKELFDKPLVGRFITALGAFPVDRAAADMKSYRRALGLLKDGEALLIFSQGTRVRELDVKGAKNGAALFAIKAGVPVIPAGINAEYRLRRRLRVRFGEPVSFAEYRGGRVNTELLDSLMEGVMTEVERLASPWE
jgi:1-acyl-sn-glycerol-3-phosphate acyltransferase